MTDKMTNNSVYDTMIRMVILVLIVAWCLMIMLPFVSIILWSLIFALALHPLHGSLAKKMGGKPKLASFLIIFSFLIIVILPTSLLIGSLVDEVKELKVAYDTGTLTIPAPEEKVKDWPVVGDKLYTAWQNMSVDLEQTIVKNKEQLTELATKLAKGILSTTSAVLQIMVSLIIAGILLTIGSAGESVRKFFRKVAGDKGDDFADTTMKTVGSVVKGIIGVALILALLHGVILMLAGIPYAGIWTLLIFVLCILQLPVVFVTLPIVVYIFAIKEPVPAIIWTVLLLVAGLSDNVLKPILLGKGAPVPMLIIFIGVIGGFILSGFIGLFTGAIVMSIGYKLYIGWVNSADDDEVETLTEQ